MTATGRPSGRRRGLERRDQGRHVVAVHLQDAPAEGREAGRQVARVLGRQAVPGVLAAPAELLELVVVDDGDEVVGAVARRHVGGLPDLALLALAVAEEDVGAARPCPRWRAPRAKPRPAERPMPSEPVEMSMPGSLFMSGMTLQPRALLVERVELVERGSSRPGPWPRTGPATSGPWRG